ncbi:hypothetical protein AAG906_011473 [Vitis piasezkii]
MEEEISSNYMCYPIAKALWDNIIQMYSDLGNQSQIYELQLKLGDICQGENSDLDLFNDYEWKNTDDFNYFKKMVEMRHEESQRNVMLGKKLLRPVENSTLLGTTTVTSRNPNNRCCQDDKLRVWCDHCNKPRHTRETY